MNSSENKLVQFLLSRQGIILIGSVITILLITYIIVSTTIQSKNSQSANISPTPSQTAQNINVLPSDIYFLKNPDGKTVYINVNTGKQPISGAQLAIAFNPNVLNITAVTPGNFFDNPIISDNAIDKQNGIIHFSLSMPPLSAQVYGEGTIAVMTYSRVSTASAATTLTFLSQTKIITEGINVSPIKKLNTIQLP